MTFLLNLIVLFVCLRWLHKSDKRNPVLAGIVFSFIGLTVLSFIIALKLEHDYLDGVNHLMAAGGSAVLFWLVSVALLLYPDNSFNPGQKAVKISMVSIVILLPLFMVLLVANMNFKIGG